MTPRRPDEEDEADELFESAEAESDDAAARPDAAAGESLARERDELREKFQRALADAENARKRHLRELADSRQYAISRFAGDLLEVVDNLDRALAGAKEKASGDPLVTGVKLVSDLLQKTLKAHGVEPIDALGKPFDPNFHQAVAEDPTDEVKPGTVTAELMKGYRIGDRLLRPTMVRVAKAAGRRAPGDSGDVADGAGAKR